MLIDVVGRRGRKEEKESVKEQDIQRPLIFITKALDITTEALDKEATSLTTSTANCYFVPVQEISRARFFFSLRLVPVHYRYNFVANLIFTFKGNFIPFLSLHFLSSLALSFFLTFLLFNILKTPLPPSGITRNANNNGRLPSPQISHNLRDAAFIAFMVIKLWVIPP